MLLCYEGFRFTHACILGCYFLSPILESVLLSWDFALFVLVLVANMFQRYQYRVLCFAGFALLGRF